MSTLSRLVRRMAEGYYSHPLLTIDSFFFRPLYFGALMTSRRFRREHFISDTAPNRFPCDRLAVITPIGEAPGVKLREMLPAGRGWCYPPRHHGPDDAPAPQAVDFPAVRAAWMEHQLVEVGSSYPFDPKRSLLLVDQDFGRLPPNGSMVTGHLRGHGRRRALIKQRREPMPAVDGVFLGGNGSSNYYHWLIEIVTKLLVLHRFPEAAGLPLLVSKRVVEVPSFGEILQVLAPERELCLLNEGDSYQVSKLLYIEPLVTAPFHIMDCRFRAGYFATRPEAVRFLRDAVLPKLGSAACSAWPRRIFLARGSRRNFNQDELVAVAARYGFEPLRMEEHSFMDQAAIFANASAIIGPTGAAWSNLAFASMGCKACCWLPEELEEFATFSNLAGIVGVDYRHLTYPSGVRTPSEAYGHSYRLIPEEFGTMLKRLFPR